MTQPADNHQVADALANWIVQVRWALEACHEHVGMRQLKAVIDAESHLLVTLESATSGTVER